MSEQQEPERTEEAAVPAAEQKVEEQKPEIAEGPPQKNKRPLRINGGTLFLGAVFLVVITVFATFFVADRLYYHGALFRESDSVSFSGEDTDKYKTAKFQDILTFIQNNYCLDFDINKVIEGAINGAVEALGDPYSRYLKPGELNSYVNSITGTYTGVGITYSMAEDGMLISEVVDGSPAAEQGIRANDTITSINGKKASEYSAEELSAVFGTAGNTVKLSVTHPDGTNAEATLQVSKVSQQSVFVTNYEGVMYIRITQFDEDTGTEFLKAMEKIEKLDCTGIILDLRNNGGGSVDQAAIVADRILPEGLIAYSEDKNGKRISELKSDAACIHVPLAVLVNAGTASASELVTGAIRDFKKGTVIGQRTYGKALGQTRKEYAEDGSGIVLTVARYFTPSGECIHGKGIEPEIPVQLPEAYQNAQVDKIPFDQDSQLQEAFAVLKG